MRLLIADDHTLFRDALVQYIERAEDHSSVSVSKDFNEVYSILKEDQSYDLVLLDFRMPGMNGLQGLKKIKENFPNSKVALMSGVAEPEDVKAAMDLGAVGYFPKTLSGKALIKAIQLVLTGEKFIPIDSDTVEIMPSYYGDEKRVNFIHSNYNGSGEGSIDGAEDVNLTPRETEVLGYLAKGASNKEIANALGLQVVTVKLHIRGICTKLEANNRTHAAMKAVQLGLVSNAEAV